MVIDTSAYVRFANGDHTVLLPFQRAAEIYMPAVVVGELLYGYLKGTKTEENRSQLQKFLSLQRVTIVSIDRRIAERYAALRHSQATAGKALADNDLWIAATAFVLNQPLLTFDSDFKRIYDLTLVFDQLLTDGYKERTEEDRRVNQDYDNTVGDGLEDI